MHTCVYKSIYIHIHIYIYIHIQRLREMREHEQVHMCGKPCAVVKNNDIDTDNKCIYLS